MFNDCEFAKTSILLNMLGSNATYDIQIELLDTLYYNDIGDVCKIDRYVVDDGINNEYTFSRNNYVCSITCMNDSSTAELLARSMVNMIDAAQTIPSLEASPTQPVVASFDYPEDLFDRDSTDVATITIEIQPNLADAFTVETGVAAGGKIRMYPHSISGNIVTFGLGCDMLQGYDRCKVSIFVVNAMGESMDSTFTLERN